MARSRTARRLVAIALAVLAAGCGDAPAPDPVEPILDLSAPWQPQPFRVRDDVLVAAFAACRTAGPDVIPANATIVLADVRGANRIDFLLSGPLGDSRTCTVAPSANGAFEFSGGGGGPMAIVDLPGVGQARVESMSTVSGTNGSGLEDSSSSVIGRAGSGVATVDVILPTGRRVRATTANGWFAAWWPTGDTQISIQAIGPDGQPIGPPQR